jgi:hypothetical protein
MQAEAEATKSEAETEELMANYQKAFQTRKDVAVDKAVDLILRG